MFSFLREVAVNGSLVRLPQHQRVFISQKCLLRMWIGQPNNNTLQKHSPFTFRIPPYLLIDPRLVPTLAGFLFFPVYMGGTGTQRGRAVAGTKGRTGDIFGKPSTGALEPSRILSHQIFKITWEGGWVNWGSCDSGSTESELEPGSPKFPRQCFFPIFSS